MPRARLSDLSFFDLFSELQRQGVRPVFDRVVARGRPWVGCAKRIGLSRAALEWHVVDVTLDPVHGMSGKILGLLVHCCEKPAAGAGPPVPADSIVRLAEEAGLIGRLGDRVLRMACAQAREWRGMGLRELRVAVDLSASQVCSANLERMVLDALGQTGLPPANLDLGLTESVVMEDIAGAVACFERFKRHGVQLLLDDFGTGYSSLAYPRLFSIDALKIDRLFLDLVPDNVRAAGLVGPIIAEGVEHEGQLRFPARRRRDEIQGYYFSRPLPPEALTAMLAARLVLPAPLRLQALHAPWILLVDADLDRRCALGAPAALPMVRGGRIVHTGCAAEALVSWPAGREALLDRMRHLLRTPNETSIAALQLLAVQSYCLRRRVGWPHPLL